MDSGKLEAMKKVHWHQVQSCSTCAFSHFDPGQDWGICALKSNIYRHNKHKRDHPLPAHRGAVCDSFNAGRGYGDIVGFLDSEVTS